VGITGSALRLPLTTSTTSVDTQPVPRGWVTCIQELSALRPLAVASSPPGRVTTMSKSVLGPPRTFEPPATARTTTPLRVGVLVAVAVGDRAPVGEAPGVGVPRVAVTAPAGVAVLVPVAWATGRGLLSSGSSASRTM
jgi:hypothetical protein